MKLSKKYMFKNKNKNKKKINNSFKKNKYKKNKSKKIVQNGGFIGTMFNLALSPIKLVAKPLYNMLSKSNSMNSLNSISNSNLNSGHNSNSSNLSDSTKHTIHSNNQHIGTLKNLSMMGYDRGTLMNYINQLHHINV